MVLPSNDPYFIYDRLRNINNNFYINFNSEIRTNITNQHSFDLNIQQKMNDFILTNRRN